MTEANADVGEQQSTYVAVTPIKAVPQGVRLPRVSWRRDKTLEEAAAPDLAEADDGAPRSFWHDGPASAADVFAYTRSGAWLQGKRNDLLEMAGQAWGYGVALPITVILGFVIWLSHRFHRAFAATVVIAVLVLTFPQWGGDEQVSPTQPQIGATP